MMNVFRLSGDMLHLASILKLLLKIHATRSCAGELQAHGSDTACRGAP